MITNSLDDGFCAAVSNQESLTDYPTDEEAAAGCPVTDYVSGDDVVFCRKDTLEVWLDYDRSTRKTLADIVIRVTLEVEFYTARNESTKRLSR